MNKSLGQIAYEAHLDEIRSGPGIAPPLPEWHGLADSNKLEWEATAAAKADVETASGE